MTLYLQARGSAYTGFAAGDRLHLIFNGNAGTGTTAYGASAKWGRTALTLFVLQSGIGIPPNVNPFSTAMTLSNWELVT